MNVLVVGANGAVGRKVVAQLKDTEHKSVALVRKDEQVSELESVGADKVVVADLEGDISNAFDDVDAVIFAAGSGGSTGSDKTLLVDLWGSKKVVDAASKNGVKKLVQLSATDSPDPDNESDVMRPYAVAKHMSDYYIEQSDLNYTIVRPGPLQNDEGTGKIDASFSIEGDPNGYTIPRDDVATTLINALDITQLDKQVVYIQSGDTTIREVLEQLK
ncbi:MULTISPECIES: SDR family oxidoreductase [unclassified Staphylococcus]|uniref:SDR family oxidoreductase n=1 Tax=unclassified Staphylococcus TaxID=91994 RepID=UPI00187F11EA|nr:MULTISPECIES: SDR family oxidoreductase [unclassified Staphylococcus]MBF2756571.1 SDR family oxidoreductase [Staphylococcus haemolyticus]MBF2773819.1 SDR family oxidoreductase [Staphylococcus haemolyticus]MBF2775935.1 SDR family oxidoreductase [Staphylococcus haemolyticus]MBF2815504.1 SDR family oxidoreductase [Staphylococcus haemolyticus]MBF9719722.1 SDR family oxidoreductase [Staphylococcus haemolyticus]